MKLAPARRLAKASGAKLNDVVMAICAGALRHYLQTANALPRRPLVAFVPVSSLRELGNKDMSNQVSGMLCSLATNIADPAARLTEIVASSQAAKKLSGRSEGCACRRLLVPRRAADHERPVGAVRQIRHRQLDQPDGQRGDIQRAGAAGAVVLRGSKGQRPLPGIDPGAWHGAEHSPCKATWIIWISA